LKTTSTTCALSDPSIGAVALESAAVQEQLRSIIAQSSGRLVMFDLDSTLLNNRPRNVAIMREFGSTINHATLMQADIMHFRDWSSRNSLLSMGLPGAEIDGFLSEYDAFWAERFFTSEYCRHDVAIAGANQFVNEVKNAGGRVCYMTGRPELMRDGTLDSLAACGFPLPGSADVELTMKPLASASDDDFKRTTLERLGCDIRLLAAFDNEPTHINSYKLAFPHAVCIHLLTDHSMRPVKLLDGIVSIADFSY